MPRKTAGCLAQRHVHAEQFDDGADMMSFEEVDVAEIIRTVERESQFNLEQKGMSMRCVIPNDILINGNSGLLYSTFRNLTDNAIAYAGVNTHPPDGRTERGWLLAPHVQGRWSGGGA